MEAKELKKTKAIVENLLRNDPQTRNSDSFLYIRVIETIARVKYGNSLSVLSMSVSSFLMNHRSMGFPPFESVRRSRQKIQQENPELKACDEVEAERQKNIKHYQSM